MTLTKIIQAVFMFLIVLSFAVKLVLYILDLKGGERGNDGDNVTDDNGVTPANSRLSGKRKPKRKKRAKKKAKEKEGLINYLNRELFGYE